MAIPVTRKQFTVDEYYRLGEAGLLAPDERVELVNGELFTMPPIGPGHAGCVDELADLLRARLPDWCLVRARNPLRIGERSQPEPDIAVVHRRPDYYRSSHPTSADVLLVIEVADSTLTYDREIKAPMYAQASIPEYWIVNLVDAEISVYRYPRAGRHQSVQTLVRGDTLQPLNFTEISIAVTAILA